MAEKQPESPKPVNRAEQGKTIKVRATRHITEGGKYLKPGDEIEITEKRAEALGKLVTR